MQGLMGSQPLTVRTIFDRMRTVYGDAEVVATSFLGAHGRVQVRTVDGGLVFAQVATSDVERLTPGTIARHCTAPIIADCLSDKFWTPLHSLGRTIFSRIRIATPPMISAQHTTTALPSRLSIASPNNSARTTAGTQATTRLRTKRHAPASLRNNPVNTSQKVRQ